MLVKAIIIIFLFTILYTLGSSFYFMVKDKGEGNRTLKRLMWRIGLSILLLLLLYVMYLLGWIALAPLLILLADEPTGNLDPETAARVHDELLRLIEDEGLGALVATHNLDLAEGMSRIARLER